jgi:hypothetical protein
MKWKMKVGIEWRPSLDGRPKIGGRPATFSLLSPPLSPSIAQPPHHWDRLEGLGPHVLSARPPLGSPIKGLTWGASTFIPQDHKQPQIS